MTCAAWRDVRRFRSLEVHEGWALYYSSTDRTHLRRPKGVAVACQAIGEAGAFNAGLMAAQILATSDPALSEAIQNWRAQQTDNVPHAVD